MQDQLVVGPRIIHTENLPRLRGRRVRMRLGYSNDCSMLQYAIGVGEGEHETNYRVQAMKGTV